MNTTIFKRTPGVLAFQHAYVMSDVTLFNESEQGVLTPVKVIRHGIRGTQNLNQFSDSDSATSADAKRREVSNIQETDTAKLSPDAIAMIAQFEVRFLDLKYALSSYAPGADDTLEEIEALRQSVTDFIERAKSSAGLQEISRRYARNILNGRWLWRNRLIASEIAISVFSNDTLIAATENALNIPLNHFDDYSDAEKKLGEIICKSLSGHAQSLRIKAKIKFGIKGAIEVYPSQNYLETKEKGFARSLYRLGHEEKRDKKAGIHVIGNAAIRDQKAFNAIRTIDTWYQDFAMVGRPIVVEPNGASLQDQKFYRNSKDASAFTLIKKLNVLDVNSPDGMFMLACLVRGGVYSERESGKKSKKDKK